MKLIIPALAAVLVALSVCPRAIAQDAPVLGLSAAARSTNAFSTVSTNPAPRKLADLLETNAVPGCPNGSLFDSQRKGRRLFASGLPAPGVYRSEPYTMIVVVPGARADDRAIVGSSGPVPYIPMHRPELRLIPWGQANSQTNR